MSTTKYARSLEAEVARERAEAARQRVEIDRLRAENRALLNSILGIAGVPPIIVAEPAAPEAQPARLDPAAAAPAMHTTKRGRLAGRLRNGIGFVGARHAVPAADRDGSDRLVSNARRERSGKSANAAVPLRKRSWQQINRTLEFESAKKKNNDMNGDA